MGSSQPFVLRRSLRFTLYLPQKSVSFPQKTLLLPQSQSSRISKLCLLTFCLSALFAMSLIWPRLITPFRTAPRLFDEMLNEMAHMERAFSVPMRYGIPSRPSEVVSDSSKFQLSLDVAQYKPEELKISLEGRTLTVEGRQETKDDKGYFESSFSRVWTLPDDVNINDLKSSLTETGRLSIEAPKKSPEVTEIPIQNTSSLSSSAANPAPNAGEQKKD